jgi:hypothetical protein
VGKKPAKDNPIIFISYFYWSGLLLLSRDFLPGKSVNYSLKLMRFYDLEGKIFLVKQVYTLDVMISNTEIEANRLPRLP